MCLLSACDVRILVYLACCRVISHVCFAYSDFVLFPVMFRHGIFLPIGGFPPIERSHGSFLRSVQIR